MDGSSWNVAHRLHDELTALRSLWSRTPTGPATAAMKARASAVIGTSSSLVYVATLAAMVNELEEALEATDPAQSEVVRPQIAKLRSGLAPSVFRQRFDSAKGEWLSETVLLAIQTAAVSINGSSAWVETRVPERAIEALIRLAREAADAIGADESLPVDLRLLLLRRLRDVEQAASEYAVGGIARLQVILEALEGRVRTDGRLKRWWSTASGARKLSTTAAALAAVVGFGADVTTIAEGTLWGNVEVPAEVSECLSPPPRELPPAVTRELPAGGA